MRSWLLAGMGIGVSARVLRAEGALALSPRLDGEMLYVSAPDLHFLTGRPLERLRDGSTVTYIAQLSLSLDEQSDDPPAGNRSGSSSAATCGSRTSSR